MSTSDAPLVYSAIYSGVPVYEIMCREVPIMRRMADSYMNATQILKIAGFSKPRRTKILEQEVLQGLHEKIQGGYGKYQGTWIPLEAGRTLAQRYQVDHLIDSLLSFDPAVDHLGTKPPTRKVPRPPKQEKIEDDEEEISPQFEYPMARTTPARSRQHSTASALSPPTFSNQQEPTPTYYQEVTQQDAENYVPSLVAKRLFDEELTQRDFFDSVYSKRSRVRTTTTDSVQRDVPVIDKTTDFSHLSRDQKNRELMLHLFVEQDSELNTQNFVGLIRDKVEPNTLLVNLILDEQEHTLLHWAASCGRIEIVRLLVHHGVKVNIPAKGGVTPLMKAIESNRNYANQSMDELLTMLGPSLFTADESGRTALHHAAALSRYRSKRAMSSYYMQCIARYIEDTRSATNSPTIAFVDTADNSQDTALHIACRYRNHKCVMLLLQLGASKDLKNNNEETAQDLCKYDYRLLRLMQIEENIEPTVYDDFDDVPTTPISDMTESEAESVQEHILQRKISCSTIGSISGMEPFSRVVDSQISKTCKYFGNAKSEVQELKYYRDRFDLIRKHTAKIGKTVGVNVGTTITEEDPNVKRIKLEKPMSQKQVLAETKLSSQLIRLDSLVKSSLEEQGELLAKLDGLSKERSRKEERYQELLGMVCHVPPQMVDEVLTKVIE